ncbi:MAG: GGDEF domain-containing protein, partial [Kangiella sp.]|nr:GGDEF domain-containing protein [Kangiella sp.]
MKREQIKDTTVKLMAVWYNRLLVTFLAFLPLWFILYIASEISPDKIFVAHTFHVIVISLAVLF